MNRSNDPRISRLLDLDPVPMFIDGRWRTGDPVKATVLVAPATGETLCRVASAGAGEVDEVVGAADQAFRDGRWSGLRPDERARSMQRWSDLMERDSDTLAELEMLHSGKSITEARGDVARAIDGVRFYAASARNIRGETITVSSEHHSYTLLEPLGVVVAIVPWNVPLVLAVSKAAPALAAGNTVIVKPSQVTPLTALHIARLWEEAELPNGVFNVITGSGADVGEALCTDPRVTGITFTGSTETGLRLGSLTALQNKRAMLELGGKSPNIVLADADLDRAIQGASNAIFYGQGQICSAGSRLIVEADVHDVVVAGVVALARSLKVGDPSDPLTDMGSLISKVHRDGVLAGVEQAVARGATLATGGVPHEVPGFPGGAFMEPTVLTDVAPDAPIACEEVFGPVLVVHRVTDVEQAIEVANSTRFGLAAGIWSRDVALARRTAARLEAGVIWINDFNRFDPAMPFGGVKMSGSSHREWSHLALMAFMEHRSVWERQT
jgi:acyl-CoA reductase-like NAD-dependent aldehyde dehydrogenase